MSKKRKTRKEKIKIANKNQISLSQDGSMPTYSFVSEKPLEFPIKKAATHVSTSSYAYVTSDIKQTFIVTSILLTVSIVLYFLIQNQIIRLSMFGY